MTGKQSAMEGDAWVLSFIEAENRLLVGGCRRKCLSILKTLRDRHQDNPANPVTTYIMKVRIDLNVKRICRPQSIQRLNRINFFRRSCCTSAKSILVKWNGTSRAQVIASMASYCNSFRACSVDVARITSCRRLTSSAANHPPASKRLPNRPGDSLANCSPIRARQRNSKKNTPANRPFSIGKELQTTMDCIDIDVFQNKIPVFLHCILLLPAKLDLLQYCAFVLTVFCW